MRGAFQYFKSAVSPTLGNDNEIQQQRGQYKQGQVDYVLCDANQQQSDWAFLPEGILNTIMTKIIDSKHTRDRASAYKDFVAARGVCSEWRQIGNRFNDQLLWKDGQIHLPEQLQSLCPPSLCKGCVFCFVRRFPGESGGQQQQTKYRLFLGTNYLYGNTKFLLTAIKTNGRSEFVIYMTRNAGHDGLPPIARVVWNSFKRKYYIYLEKKNPLSEGITKKIEPAQLLGSTKWSPSWSNMMNTLMLRPRVQTATFLNVISSSVAFRKGKVIREQRLNQLANADGDGGVGGDGVGQGQGQGEEEKDFSEQNGLIRSGKMKLVRRMPYWNKYSRCWEQEMWGRAKMSSQKNVQFHVQNDDDDRIAIQFGKAEHDIYVLDFNPCVLTAIQAFAIGLVQFSRSK
eukprot:TRINITY_DN7983_c1_g1_i5.p1 TRINITY_DN7983_c1_g1~~TRINITY_DN7983_c1_g1_i5.p1  ORF type:complete len:399 (-),score=42.87 TRINITY_DN7983_c1_g1_i5:457-1653(-)